MDSPLIEMRQVRKAFNGQTVLDGVDLAIEEGLVTTIIGRSGVGKSVLLKHLIGLLHPDSGEILFHGHNLPTLSRAERRALKGRFSYVFQNMALFDSMTVFENVALPLEERTHQSRREIRERVMRRLEQLDLADIAEKYPSQISGGMCKRVALARALVTEPEIVLFDEPTTGLDPVRKNTVHEMIARYQREVGFTAVVVTHDIPDVFEISQRVAMLAAGRIVFFGTAEAIQASRDLVVRRFLQGRERLPEEDAPAGEPLVHGQDARATTQRKEDSAR
jgi:phospholipid/cholesterol/gamma-HCH transport system ATP-binding protein